MELYVAMAVGAMTGFGAAKSHAALQGKWWLSIPAGILGGIAGRALWSESLAPTFQDSTLAGTAVAAVIGGAALSVLTAIARRIVTWRMRLAAQA